MEIRQIKYFVAVIDCGSLSSAARQVHVAQSALSKQMSALEDDLGVQLFHRSHNGVVASEAGKVFYEYAQGMLKHLGDARAAVSSSPDSLSGSITVALPQSVATLLAMPLMRAVAARYPQVAFHLNEELTGNVMDQLLHGRIDLALFSAIDLPPPFADSTMQPQLKPQMVVPVAVAPPLPKEESATAAPTQPASVAPTKPGFGSIDSFTRARADTAPAPQAKIEREAEASKITSTGLLVSGISARSRQTVEPSTTRDFYRPIEPKPPAPAPQPAVEKKREPAVATGADIYKPWA